MAISWAWLYHSNFQLISNALPGFRTAKLKVVSSSAHKQHLKQEEDETKREGRLHQDESQHW